MNPVLRKLWYTVMPSFPVKKQLYGLDLYYDSRDYSAVWYKSSRRMEKEEIVPEILSPFEGHLWDVGANIGLYSLVWMAYGGSKVTAFELSPKAAGYLRRNAAINNLRVTVCARPLTLTPRSYRPPITACAGNTLIGDGNVVSISLLSAVEKYGLPDCIKIDIEGGEYEFLQDRMFKKLFKPVKVLVEFHGGIPVDMNMSFINDRLYQVYL